MKKEKLTLEKLVIDSFTTGLEHNHLKGGAPCLSCPTESVLDPCDSHFCPTERFCSVHIC